MTLGFTFNLSMNFIWCFLWLKPEWKLKQVKLKPPDYVFTSHTSRLQAGRHPFALTRKHEVQSAYRSQTSWSQCDLGLWVQVKVEFSKKSPAKYYLSADSSSHMLRLELWKCHLNKHATVGFPSAPAITCSFLSLSLQIKMGQRLITDQRRSSQLHMGQCVKLLRNGTPTRAVR